MTSEFELYAVLQEGFAPSSILVNGVAKHHWLPRRAPDGLHVHFDSLMEVEQLLPKAIDRNWHVGLRVHVTEERDQDDPSFGGQFGLVHDEVARAALAMARASCVVESIHFHLGTNLTDTGAYERALRDVSRTCADAGIQPWYVDFGGGLPVPGEWNGSDRRARKQLDLHAVRQAFETVRAEMPRTKEIWLENGRFVTARSAVLVTTVRDVKERPESRYIICDGGRVNQALVSDWETHDLLCVPERLGPSCLTTVCGPNCMAYDRLDRVALPRTVSVGDCIVWMNAGAYHIPWETRFSHGLAAVVWCDAENRLSVVRQLEDCVAWWRNWR